MYRILIAVDGSDLALDAVRHGIALLRRGGLQATLVLGHVQEEATLMELATRGADMVAAASVEAAQDLMASAVALVDAAGVPYETEIGSSPHAIGSVDCHLRRRMKGESGDYVPRERRDARILHEDALGHLEHERLGRQ
ncbi:MAG TPA: universal stress protein, partial [Alicycliphilus sp.]|nr:universal stress protein [Alicycliphilus sp.]